ncbi:MAG: hypothetical protein JZU50_13020 [Desulfobulbaceae bacterium]|jgi:hypothetical protein|nr:hypothetical protein [Desulfobulbaceae bacterium]
MTKLFANSDLPQGMDNGPLGCILPAYAALLSQHSRLGGKEDTATFDSITKTTGLRLAAVE